MLGKVGHWGYHPGLRCAHSCGLSRPDWRGKVGGSCAGESGTLRLSSGAELCTQLWAEQARLAGESLQTGTLRYFRQVVPVRRKRGSLN